VGNVKSVWRWLIGVLLIIFPRKKTEEGKISEEKPKESIDVKPDCFKYSKDGEVNGFPVEENFILKEFECPCCNTVKLSPKLLHLLQSMRNKMRTPLVITTSLGFAGAFRCPDRNEQAGGADNSFHLHGMAVDVALNPTGLTAKEFVEKAIDVGFKGIGVYGNRGFVHLDCRESDSVVLFHDDVGVS